MWVTPLRLLRKIWVLSPHVVHTNLHLHNTWPLTNVVQMLKIPVFNPLSCDPGWGMLSRSPTWFPDIMKSLSSKA